MTDLVERLRETGSDLADDAADEIERLEQDTNTLHADICAENDNLRAEIERLTKRIEELLDANGYTALALAKAEAEIERLRAALTRLTTDITSSAAAMDAVSLSIFEDALAALGEKP